MPVLNPTPSRAARYAAPVALLTALLLGPAAAQSVSDDPIEMEALEVTAFSSQARALDLRRNATEI